MLDVLPWILLGILVFSRKSREPFGLLFSLMLAVSGTVSFDDGILNIIREVFPYPGLVPLRDFMGCIGAMLFVTWHLFPAGRFVPKWARWGYSRDHVTDLTNLGERAGTALHFLQLNERKQVQ